MKTFIFIFTLFGVIACSPKILFEPNFVTSNIVIDGAISEWPDTMRQASKSSIVYNIIYSDDFLYLVIKISGSDIQKKIVQKGLTLWIDSTNSKKKDVGIYYPKEADYEQFKQFLLNDNQSYFEMFNTQYNSGLQFIEIIDSHTEISPSIAYSKSEKNFSIAVVYDSVRCLVYEAQIPLKYITNKPFCIGIETGKFQASQPEETFDLSQSSNAYATHDSRSNVNPLQPIDYRQQTTTYDDESLIQATKFWIRNIQIPNIHK